MIPTLSHPWPWRGFAIRACLDLVSYEMLVIHVGPGSYFYGPQVPQNHREALQKKGQAVSVLLSCHGLGMSHGARTLFSDLDIHIAQGEKIGLIGANGSGKSTLLKILSGKLEPERGERMQKKNTTVVMVDQEPSFSPGATIRMELEQALSLNPSPSKDENLMISTAQTRLGFSNLQASVDSLSGGWQKRLAIARALVQEPDLLLLDEPTNHLDMEGILWLEHLLSSENFSFVLVSHDRTFLQRCTNRMLQLDPRFEGGILSVDGDYSVFLEKREEYLASRAKREQTLANKVRREIEWLRRGPKARTTKSQARIDAAREMIEDLSKLRTQKATSPADIDFSASGRKSRRLLVAEHLSKSLGGRALFSDLNLLMRPATRLGLVGENGSGKSTLLKILAKEIQPDEGSIHHVEGLRVAYFEQHRQSFDENLSLKRTLAEQGDSVIYRQNSIHVVTWAKRFGFRPEQMETPVGSLSGGERARIAIAKLMLIPADLLLLDEPTNDLDMETIEVLEESLLEFPGAIVLVTHDRLMLDRVCSALLALDGRGSQTFLADSSQWEQMIRTKPQKEKQKEKQKKSSAKPRAKKKGLGYLEQREFDGLEQAITTAEERLELAQKAMEDPAIASDAQKLMEYQQELSEAEAEVERLYSRWSELDDKRKG